MSRTWFSALAQAAAPQVPAAVHAMPLHCRSSGLPSAYPAHAVETTKPLQGCATNPRGVSAERREAAAISGARAMRLSLARAAGARLRRNLDS
jgi:hypothetical protein